MIIAKTIPAPVSVVDEDSFKLFFSVPGVGLRGSESIVRTLVTSRYEPS